MTTVSNVKSSFEQSLPAANEVQQAESDTRIAKVAFLKDIFTLWTKIQRRI